MTRDGLSRSGMIVIALAALSSSALNEFASGPARAAARHRHPRPELLLPEAPAGANSFALTHDGKILAMVDGDTLSLWDTRTWIRRRSIYVTSPPPLSNPVLTQKKVESIRLAFVPDDTMLVLATTQSGLKTAERQNPYQQFYRYDLQRWTMPSLQPLPPIHDGTLSADGQQALIRIKDDKFCRLDLRTGARLTTVPVELDPPDFYVSPDGALAAPEGGAVTLDVRSLHTGKTVRTLKDTRAETWLANPILPPVEFSPDRRFAASAGEDPDFQLPISEHAPTDAAWLHQLNVKIWDLHTGKLLRALPGRSSQDDTQVLRFSSDSRRLVSMGAGMSRWLYVWSTLTGKQLLDAFSFGDPHQYEFYFFGESLMLTPQAELVAGRITREDIDPKSWEHWLHHESHLGLWDLRTGKLQSISPQAPRAIAGLRFSPDGRWVAAGDAGDYRQVKPVRLWNRSNGKLVRVWQLPEPIKTLDFSPDSRLLRVGELDEVGWWKIATGQLDHILATPRNPGEIADRVLLSSDGKTEVRMYYTDMSLEVWDVRTNTRLRRLERFHSDSETTLLSPDGQFLANLEIPRESSDERELPPVLKLWNVSTGQLAHTFLDSKRLAGKPLAISPDNRTLVCGGTRADALQLWDVATGRLRMAFSDDGTTTAAAFSTDSKLLAQAIGWQVRLRNAYSGALIETFSSSGADVTAVSFSADGRVLGTGSSDGTVKLWDIDSGKLLLTCLGLPPPVNRSLRQHSRIIPTDWIAVSPDGYYHGSPAALRLIHWRVGKRIFPAERFARRFH